MKLNRIMKTPDLFSLLNAAFGTLSIIFSLKKGFFEAALFMVIAVVFDYLDGMFARRTGKAHEFGKELDSLCDIISFGAAPAVFGFVYAGASLEGPAETLLMVSIVVFVLGGALRLARFNITKAKGVFEGMPITLNGIILPAAYIAMLPPAYYSAVYLVSGLLMISSFRIKKIL